MQGTGDLAGMTVGKQTQIRAKLRIAGQAAIHVVSESCRHLQMAKKSQRKSQWCQTGEEVFVIVDRKQNFQFPFDKLLSYATNG